MKIHIRLNGQIQEIEQETNLQELILSLQKHKGDHSLYYAVAVNQIFVPKDQYSQIHLKNQDEIEIISPHPGG